MVFFCGALKENDQAADSQSSLEAARPRRQKVSSDEFRATSNSTGNPPGWVASRLPSPDCCPTVGEGQVLGSDMLTPIVITC